MEDPALFLHFIATRLGVVQQRAQEELISMIPTFKDLVNMSDDDIEGFVKSVHGANSGRPANARIVYRPIIIANLKALRFELYDRTNCGALPDVGFLQAIDSIQLSTFRGNRSENIGEEESLSSPEISVP